MKVATSAISLSVSFQAKLGMVSGDGREALVPMHRIGDPGRDIAGLIEFLVSPDATYMTGQNLLVDGGLIGSIHAHIAGRPKSGGA